MITVQTKVNVPPEKAWEYWTGLEHISGWAFASDDWEAIAETNDLQEGGKFKTRMQAKDKSAGFDFEGVYTKVKQNELLEFDLTDGRHVKVEFRGTPDGTEVVESFDPESENPHEVQQAGWQSFLDNFKKYVEKK